MTSKRHQRARRLTLTASYRGLIVSASCSLLLGCGITERIDQCNELVRSVNQGLSPIRAELQAEPELATGEATAERYTALSASYSNLSKEISELSFKNSIIERIRADYSELFSQAATASTSLSKTNEATQSVTHNRVRRELERLGRRENALKARLAAECRDR